MPYEVNDTHDPKLESWVESANDPETDFPIQNLPLALSIEDEDDGAYAYVVVPIGDMALYLNRLAGTGLIDDEDGGLAFLTVDDLLDLANDDRSTIRTLRANLSALLSKHNKSLRDNTAVRDAALRPLADTNLVCPFTPHDYTDFYASLYHATNVGSMFRPDNPILPNYKHIPIGYHGRASSIVPSGTPVRRPCGQHAPPGFPAEPGGSPTFGPSKLLDYELEMGCVIARGNELGSPVSIKQAEEHMLGLCIVNDWSARDSEVGIPAAGPVPGQELRDDGLAIHRHDGGAGAVPVAVVRAGRRRPAAAALSLFGSEQVGGRVRYHRRGPHRLQADARQGAGARPSVARQPQGDVLDVRADGDAPHVQRVQPAAGRPARFGTISGRARGSRGSMLELSWDGDPFAMPPVKAPGTQRTPIELPTGEKRIFLEDHDEVVIKAYCERDGFRRIGFGECRGVIEPRGPDKRPRIRVSRYLHHRRRAAWYAPAGSD